MARRRYQNGGLTLRNGQWFGRWREDIIQDGEIKRVLQWKLLGTITDYPTRKLARRELENQLKEINDVDYRPRTVATFREFAQRWQSKVLPNLKPSTQPPIRSQLNKHLLPVLGDVQMKELSNELLQSFVTDCKRSPKTIRNLVATLRIMWKTARTWNYARHDPFTGLVLPEWEAPEEPVFNPDVIRHIIARAEPPYDTVFWLVAQTGIRRGEVCALDVRHVDLANSMIVVRRSRSGRHITNTKAKHPRVFSITPRLAQRLGSVIGDRKPDEPLFLTREGKRLHPDNFVKRKLSPLVKQLGLAGGLHAFRHGNATAQDRLNTPMKVRQQRLGHVNEATTMGYTHMVGEDDRRVAGQLDELFCPTENHEFCVQVVCRTKKKALTPDTQGLRVQ